MSFCKYSPNFNNGGKILIDNVFITDFLPKAPDLCVKAYLLGMSKCNDSEDFDNSLSYFADTLKVCEDDVISLFKYWEDLGLVQVLSTEPVEIRYLPVKSSVGSVKKFKVDKYTDFNIQVQELLHDRMIMPNEFAEFYNLIENRHIEESAVLCIIKYCVDMKGFNISPNYCLTVIKDWEREGIHTKEQAENKIQELGIIDDKMSLILGALGTKRKVQIEDKELLNKWLDSFGYDLNVIIYIIKIQKEKKHRLDINILDEILTKYFELRLMSIQEIDNYENTKDNLYEVAKSINKELGIFYEDLSKEIDTYVINWLNMGYEIDLLKMVADNCFKSSIRTLEGYNNIINKLFKLGITNINSYMQYLNDNLAIDSKIKEVLIHLNLNRNVNSMDRNFYDTWTNVWGFKDDVIVYVADLSRDKSNAIQYMNKILSNWNSEGIKTLDKAKLQKIETTDNTNFIHNNYSKEQIASLITNLDEVEV